MTYLRFPTLLVAIVLAGCNALQAPPPPAAAETAAADVEVSPPQEVVEHTEQPEPVLEDNAKESATEVAINRLLRDAESAMAVDQLTTPVHDNAFDRYQAVLLLSPGNPQALSGLDQILLRYLQMARQAANSHQFKQARELLARAKSVNPDHPALKEVADDIARAQRTYSATQVKAAARQPAVVNDKEIRIDARALDRKDDRVINQLQQLAQKVRQTQETLLIVARSDAEGRWIYKIMNDAVPNYRLRGDIKVERVPRVLLLPPID